jgi:hypothetical protein
MKDNKEKTEADYRFGFFAFRYAKVISPTISSARAARLQTSFTTMMMAAQVADFIHDPCRPVAGRCELRGSLCVA